MRMYPTVPTAITQTAATADRRNAFVTVSGTIPSYRVQTLPFAVCYHPSSMVEAEGHRFAFVGVEALTPGVLETFPFEYAGREALVEIATDEFSAVCPYSGLPDFGTLTIRYLPAEACIELKSLKYYLTSFRNVGIYQEHAAHRILDDLVALLRAALDGGGARLSPAGRHPHRGHGQPRPALSPASTGSSDAKRLTTRAVLSRRC